MRRPILLALVCAFAAGFAHAQPDPVRWTVTAEPAAAAPGDLVVVTLRGRIEGDWRMYAMDSQAGRPLLVRLAPPAGFEALGAPQQAQPQAGFDRNFNSDYTFFEREATVTQAFRVAAGAPASSRFAGAVTYMLCNDEVCLPPRQQPLSVAITVRGGECGSVGGVRTPSSKPTSRCPNWWPG